MSPALQANSLPLSHWEAHLIGLVHPYSTVALIHGLFSVIKFSRLFNLEILCKINENCRFFFKNLGYVYISFAFLIFIFKCKKGKEINPHMSQFITKEALERYTESQLTDDRK